MQLKKVFQHLCYNTLVMRSEDKGFEPMILTSFGVLLQTAREIQ